MPALSRPAPGPSPAFPRIDTFLKHHIAARALAFALERGLVDRLATRPMPAGELAAALRLPPERLDVLVGLLVASGVLSDGSAGSINLSPAFRAVLPARDLIEAKLAFATAAADDLNTLFPEFIADLPAFMERSRTFELFRYDRCFEVTEDNLVATRRWVSYTTCLTRYEAGPCLDRLDLARHRRMLDLGGNSGEFAAQACARAPDLRATVADLPVVCVLGRENLAGRPEGERVAFHPCDMRRDPLPEGQDLVTFKSVLHDWPETEARALLARAHAALVPGGRLVIFERAPMSLRSTESDFAASANLVFEPFFRPADFYRSALRGVGFGRIAVASVELETAFHLIEATKP
ncbi:methyltransferase [Methylobacterium segetis]|uniref:methyltransferase n=1 Tax=Methylobacterium segetis TaxID=2488750 RepID=UPI001042A5B6|nr:methyltransferase [Methylobacterium segetis]